MIKVDSRFLTELQLQFLVDKVAEALGEKCKYVAIINGRRQYGAAAYVLHWIYGRTKQRRIEFSKNATCGWGYSIKTFSDESYRKEKRRSLIKLIVHEIAHFKREERNRNKARKNGRISRHKHHTKRFKTILQNLLAKIELQLPTLMQLDLTSIQLPPPKPKPTKTEIYNKQLVKVQHYIKYLESRKKRLETVLKKWRKREKYIAKKLLVMSLPVIFEEAIPTPTQTKAIEKYVEALTIGEKTA